MRQRDEKSESTKPSVSVSARASFFVEEQKRASETQTAASKTAALNRHPSAKIHPVDKKDSEVSTEL